MFCRRIRPILRPSSSTATTTRSFAQQALARERASPCRPSKSRRPRHFRPAVPVPGRTIACRNFCNILPGRLIAAQTEFTLQTLSAQPCFLGAGQPHCQTTNSAAAPASCAGWFPQWEQVGVGRRYRTSCLAPSSNPSWPSSSDKRIPWASGRRFKYFATGLLAGKPFS